MGSEAFTRELGDFDATTAVVEAIAAVRNEEPDEMEPLHSYVDGDALDRLAEGDGDVQIQFRYRDCTVVVDGDEVRVDGIENDD